MKRSILTLSLLALAGLTVAPSASAQVTRTQAIVTARAFANHHWSAKAININPTRCPAGFDWYPSAGTQTYQQVSFHYVGDFVGLPYNWGGYGSLRDFDEKIASGYGAGAGASTNLEPEDEDCTAGVDCSGFVTNVWRYAGQLVTATIPNYSTGISVGSMKPGDVWNQPSYHVGVFSQTLANGVPETIESLGYNVNINRHGGYAGVGQFEPRRYTEITGEVSDPGPGTLDNPHVIQPSSTNNHNTKNWPSSVYSRYNCDTSKSEAGPEVFYQVTFDQPGSFTAAVADDGPTDVDVHILSEKNTNSCVARNDTSATTTVGCGTYYIAVDTFGGAGAYTLTTSFTPSGAACGSVAGPAPFNPKGRPGDACNSEATPSEQAFCDINLGAETCLQGSDFSFCSMPCSTDNDCADMTGGAGCCGEVNVSDGNGNTRTENYCYAASHCAGGGPSSGGVSSSGGGTSGTSGTSGGDDDGADDDGSGGDDDATSDDDTTSGGKKKKTTTTTSSCAAAPGTTTGSALLFVGLGLAALATRRRVRRA